MDIAREKALNQVYYALALRIERFTIKLGCGSKTL